MDRDAPGRAFEAAYSLLVLVFLVGIHLDSRTHVHDTPETFLTLEHGIFYAAAAGLGVLLAYAWTRRGGRRTRLPPGYGLAAAGVVLFGVAGLAGEAALRGPGRSSPWRERLAGAGVGLAMGLAYLGILAGTGGVAWNVHLAGGAVALATAAGALAGLGVTLGSPSRHPSGSW